MNRKKPEERQGVEINFFSILLYYFFCLLFVEHCCCCCFCFYFLVFLGTIQYEFASKLRGLEMSEMARLRLLGGV